ncbi:MAG TPA: cytochrome c [Anaerolineae bacterium]|nr:cytochrome c [Anaerolineae bacterium]
MGEAVYAAQCAACHGANLEGEANWKERRDDGTYRAPPHDESGHTWHHGDSYILDRIRNGNAGLDPQMQQASNMIAYKDILSEEEIMAVLAYIKSQWPDDIRAMQAQRE